MSMTVNFYKYTGNPKKINKTFAVTYNSKLISPTDTFDDQTPMLILNYDATIYSNANYCIIGSDCYFIHDRALETAQRMTLFLEKDYLMSNRDELLNLDVITNRTVNEYNSLLFDDRQKTPINYTTYSIDVGTVGDFTQSSIILAAIGGGN